MNKLIEYSLIAWSWKWRILLSVLVIMAFFSSLADTNSYFLAILNAIGVYAITQVGVLSFCENMVNKGIKKL
jgi:hypothetical protein